MFILNPKEIMPTFVVREPAKGPPVFVGDVFDHPTYTAVIVQSIDIDDRCMPPERVVTYRAATRQDLEDNGYI
jgi:hypothetical protein